VKLITWNVARRSAVSAQVEALSALEPDIVALQEVTRGTAEKLATHLNAIGLSSVITTFPRDSPPESTRRIGQLIASRLRMDQSIPPLRTPWPESVLSARVQAPWGWTDIHSTHIPHGSGHEWLKIETLETIYQAFSGGSRASPAIVCGDFNAPQAETVDGETVTWAQRVARDGTAALRKRIRGKPAERWDAGERNVLRGLERHGFVDAFRSSHGFGRREFSWFSNNRGERVGRRFDHIFVSNELVVVTCEYIHHVRENNLSDHSALGVTLATSAERSGTSLTK
jgi:exonuclease III